MASVNLAIIVGNVGKDVEVRYTPGGVAVASFSVATSEKWKDKDGEQKEKAEWHNVTAFGKLGEICGEYVKKGNSVYVQGRIQTDKYEKDGVTKYATKIIADKVQFLTRKEGGAQEGQGEAPPLGINDDDQVPF